MSRLSLSVLSSFILQPTIWSCSAGRRTSRFKTCTGLFPRKPLFHLNENRWPGFHDSDWETTVDNVHTVQHIPCTMNIWESSQVITPPAGDRHPHDIHHLCTITPHLFCIPLFFIFSFSSLQYLFFPPIILFPDPYLLWTSITENNDSDFSYIAWHQTSLVDPTIKVSTS